MKLLLAFLPLILLFCCLIVYAVVVIRRNRRLISEIRKRKRVIHLADK